MFLRRKEKRVLLTCISKPNHTYRLFQWRAESIRLTRLLKSDEHGPHGRRSFASLLTERADIVNELDRLSNVCDDCTGFVRVE